MIPHVSKPHVQVSLTGLVTSAAVLWWSVVATVQLDELVHVTREIQRRQAEERAAFMAAAAARVKELEEQKAATALRARADAAPYPSLHGAPKWWTKTGRSHVSWVAAGCPQYKSGTGYWISGEFVDSIFLTRDQVDSMSSDQVE